MSERELNTFGVIDLMTGYQPAAALTAAGRLGVFDALEDGPADCDTLARRLGTEPLATRALLDALVGLRLLTTGGGVYRGTSASQRLTTGGDLWLVAQKEAFFARQWLDLADSVRTGAPRLAPWADRLAADPEQARAFLRALVVLARETGPNLTRLPGMAPGARLLDLGGGLGSYAVPLAAAGAEVTLVELPAVAAWATDELATIDAEVRSRVRVVAADLLDHGSADALIEELGGADVVLLSHLLHDLNDADCARVLDLARRLARSGGTVAVFELPGDPDGDPPGAFGPLFDLMMRVETPGRARHLAELEQLLAAAGLHDVRGTDHPLPHGIILGTA